MAKSRFFRVAVEGDTTDGRSIEKQWLIDAAATYNRETYAARVNMEHIRGITADPPFQSLGDVLSLKTEEIEIELAGKTEKRLALFAEIEALEPLVAMNRKGQKLFSSIEIAPNFANSGKAYLVGLAVTDSPASLGTEMLQFAATQGENSPLAHRKQDKENLFTAAREVAIELADPAPDPNAGLFAKISAFVDSLTGKLAVQDGQQQSQEPKEPAAPSADAAGFAAIGLAIGELASAVQATARATEARIAQLAADIQSVTDKVEATPAAQFVQRSPATGGDATIRTDC